MQLCFPWLQTHQPWCEQSAIIRHAGKYESAAKLMTLMKHAESDAWLALGLTFHLNVLPLTRQLTSLSGFLWSRTLQACPHHWPDRSSQERSGKTRLPSLCAE